MIPTIYFYNSNGPGGGPGTLLDALTLTPLSLASATATPLTVTNTNGFFILPSGTFWAGVAFSGAPAATINNIGMLTYAPPTVGSSGDFFFQGSTPATGQTNPAGGLAFFGGTPAADFFWQFSVTVPEPASLTAAFVILPLVCGRRVRQPTRASA